MNCRDCAERLERYLDRELTDAEVDELRRHLTFCGPCDDRYRFQANLKRLVRVCCHQYAAPDTLRDRLRQILY
jgi:mycothiol system anti-sigma-R factor